MAGPVWPPLTPHRMPGRQLSGPLPDRHACVQQRRRSGRPGRDDEPAPEDPNLRAVVDAWPALTAAVRKGILAMIEAVK